MHLISTPRSFPRAHLKTKDAPGTESSRQLGAMTMHLISTPRSFPRAHLKTKDRAR